jgi:pimeloyl-ACP methyl ester carboxylesterase
MIVGAAFSFDWDLVQSSVSKFTRVCTFYPSGTAWSDPFQNAAHVLHSSVSPQSLPTCDDRVAEIRRVITHASVDRPYILVGFSVGALWERLYAARYPEEIAGIVIVDHAFLPDNTAPRAHPANENTIIKNCSAGVVLLLALMALLAGGAARRESVTIDEVAHIGAGVSYLQKLDMRMNEEHPPLAKVLAAVPLVDSRCACRLFPGSRGRSAAVECSSRCSANGSSATG